MPLIIDGTEYSFFDAYEDSGLVGDYRRSALSIFFLNMYLSIEDADEFAASSITEGGNDKKLDVCFLDQQSRKLTVVQSYLANEWGKLSAPANKASDLNTAIAWLLASDIDSVPNALQPKAMEIRDALAEGTIERIDLLYIHNCKESLNATEELKTAADATYRLCSTFPSGENIIVSHREVGLNVIEETYQARDNNILVDEWIEIPITESIGEESADWKAVIGSVPLDWLHAQYKENGDRLFSANYRDFLGYGARSETINQKIAQTADEEPGNFWVYNNGITALTKKLEIGKSVRAQGISIINGAQTTGALGTKESNSYKDGRVLMRLVECQSPELVNNIILYNNTQNEIKPADRRSNDVVQRRLRSEFADLGIEYIHRRSSSRIQRTAIVAATIAPALCAFHGDPQTAYRNSRIIFDEEKKYRDVFREDIRTGHIFLIKGLSSAIDKLRNELRERVETQSATEIIEEQYTLLKFSATKYFLFFLLGELAGQIMGRRVADLFEWACKDEVITANNVSLVSSWQSALGAVLPLVTTTFKRQGTNSFYEVPQASLCLEQ